MEVTKEEEEACPERTVSRDSARAFCIRGTAEEEGRPERPLNAPSLISLLLSLPLLYTENACFDTNIFQEGGVRMERKETERGGVLFFLFFLD